MALTVRRYGWRPAPPDHRDLPAVLDLVSAPDLISLRAELPPVYDQGQLGSCVLNSSACLVQVAEQHEGEIRPMPSRLFGYYNCRLEDGSPLAEDTGTNVRTALKVLAKYGYCAEVEWPYDLARFDVRPPARCYASAHKELATSYRTVSQWDRVLGAALVQRHPIAMGFSVYESFESSEVAKTGVVPMPSKDEAMIGGHSMAIVGRDFTRKRFPTRMYEMRNSWNKAWGDNGYCWMPAAYIESRQLSSDFWILQAI